MGTPDPASSAMLGLIFGGLPVAIVLLIVAVSELFGRKSARFGLIAGLLTVLPYVLAMLAGSLAFAVGTSVALVVWVGCWIVAAGLLLMGMYMQFGAGQPEARQ